MCSVSNDSEHARAVYYIGKLKVKGLFVICCALVSLLHNL